mmetsp:Transcript_86119/g.129048  ORF Transcript_86119/g.129048 Transcript_86119/m.129048 type:complete len:227 (-) Transcript_86119:551-1231(-)
MKGRYEEQGLNFQWSVRTEMQNVQRIIHGVGNELVKVRVGLILHIFGRLRPNGLYRIDEFSIQINRKRHKVGILVQNLLDLGFMQQMPIITIQIDINRRPPILPHFLILQRRQFKRPTPILRRPHRRGLVTLGRLRRHDDLVCDHEHTVESDSKLSNNPLRDTTSLRTLRFLLQFRQKLFRSRPCDSSQILYQFVLRHTNACILNGNFRLDFVQRDANFQGVVGVT